MIFCFYIHVYQNNPLYIKKRRSIILLSINQLCSHLCYMLHTPIRIYNEKGECLTSDLITSDQEDPLVCDPDFAALLLKKRKSDQPVLHTEENDVCYVVIPHEKDQTILMGPFCYDRSTAAASQATARKHHITHPHAYHVTFLPLDYAFEAILLLFHSGNDIRFSRSDLAFQLFGEDYKEEVRSDAYSVIYQLRETDSAHNSYAQEVREQKAIREGNLEALKASWAEVQTGQYGRLGKDELTHYRNLSVVVLTLASRSAIEGGVLPEIAYSMADAYTMKISEMRDVAKMSKLLRSAEIHFLEQVQKSTGTDNRNRYVVRCKQLIHDRLHQKISAQELADELGVSRSYLSSLFLQEEGLNLSSYILRAKVRAAEYLLMMPDLSLEQIAATLGFSSQSHFGQVFRRFNGNTPGAYREKHQIHK